MTRLFVVWGSAALSTGARVAVMAQAWKQPPTTRLIGSKVEG